MNMIRSAKNQIAELTAAAYRAAVQEGLLPEGVQTIPAVEIPKDTANGDYTTTFCLAASKAMRKNPREVAKILTEHMDLSDTYFTSVEIAGPGFLNFRLGDKWYADVLTAVEEEKGDYGRDNWLGGKKYMVEFVSANPTGPMHMGNARGGVLGDTLAEVLDWSGADVWREFYVNDFGNQIEKFAKSIEARYIQLIKGEDAIEFPEDGYHGDDIRELAKAFYDVHGDSYLEKSVEERHADMARFGLDRNIPKMKSDLERYGIKFDEWFFESSLHNSGYVKDTVEELHKLGWTYEKEGALWLKTADIMREQYRKQGKKDEDIDKLDLKDDVLRRANGFYTYFAGDIAYHRNKFAVRHFDKVINIWGADHHGHVARMKGAMDALGLDGTNRLDIVLMQLVKLVRDGEVVRMSKRIQAVSKASFIPGLFGINEPAIFGYPIMYNAILLIPFMLCPMVCSALLLVAWNLHWIAYPQVLIMTTLPVVFQTFLTTLDWRNVIFAILMFPVCWLIWRPFYKIYEKQCIEEEAAAEAAELAAQNK